MKMLVRRRRKLLSFQRTTRAVASTWARFANSTSLGGLGQAYEASSHVSRIVWILIVCALSAATAWNTQRDVADYLSYPVTTSVSVSYGNNLPFPTVTVCNRNPVQCPKLATAYMKYPEELKVMMAYSFCWTTIAQKPLINVMLDTAEPVVKRWVQRWRGNLMAAVNSKDFDALGVHENDCAEDSWPRGKKDLKEVLDFLLDKCGAKLGRLLFPKIDDPRLKRSYDELANNVVFYNESTAYSTTSAPDEDSSSSGENDLKDELTRKPVEELLFAERYSIEMANIAKNLSKRHILEEIIEDMQNFILNCTFNTESCFDKSLFVPEFTLEYGACFTFNSPIIGKNDSLAGKRKSRTTGRLFGLSLELMLNQPTYLPSAAAPGAGARISITPPGTRSDPSKDGYHIKPNTETDIVMKITNVTRLPAPYTSQCWNDWSQTLYQPLSYLSAVSQQKARIESYSYTECRSMCVSKGFIDNCNCAFNLKPFLYKGVDYHADVPYCDTTKIDILNCTTAQRKRLQSRGLSCQCHLPCVDLRYGAMLSLSQWPSNSYLKIVQRKYESVLAKAYGKGKTLFEPNEWLKTASKDEFVRVNIYYQTLMLEQIDENAKYELFQLLSDVGGALGLYLGICGVTFFEIAEFFVMFLLSLIGLNTANIDKSTPRGSNRTNTSSKTEIISAWEIDSHVSSRDREPGH